MVRFEVENKGSYYRIVDTIFDEPVPFQQFIKESYAIEFADYLNKLSTNKRFELKTNVSMDGRRVYMLYDNLKNKNVDFVPRIVGDPADEFQAYIDFLNDLWESNDEC